MAKQLEDAELITLQIAAGIALLSKSQLVDWDDERARFTTGFESSFEKAAAAEDRLFGRVMKWMQFSAGFEFLVKGVLLRTGDMLLDAKNVLNVQPKDDETSSEWWAKIRARDNVDKTSKPSFGTLGSLTYTSKNGPLVSVLEKFLKKREKNHKASKVDCDRVYAACELLRDAIRNRDAHAYVPNVRKQQNELIELFVPALNTLLDWLADEPLLRSHRETAAAIIQQSSDDWHTQNAVRDETNALARRAGHPEL